ncbi:MAG TPA: hypothetical protein VD905_05440, partial [Flavobacteriales bacterium]|nr:hypothetical protein [Flavobacteriales bacterium]
PVAAPYYPACKNRVFFAQSLTETEDMIKDATQSATPEGKVAKKEKHFFYTFLFLAVYCLVLTLEFGLVVFLLSWINIPASLAFHRALTWSLLFYVAILLSQLFL